MVVPETDLRPSVTLAHGAQIAAGASILLGSQATMTFLYANGVKEVSEKPNPNYNSLVVRIDVDGKRFLLPGDASDAVAKDARPGTLSVEQQLLALPAGTINADVLVAGYHGYSGAATGFIAAVNASIAIVASYPAFAGPTEEVLRILAQNGAQLFRTDVEDEACGKSTTKIGTPNDDRLGGCSNVKVTIENGSLVARYFP